MESIAGTNSALRTPRLSLDGQFWVRMACVLPFSLIAWTVLIGWALHEGPIYVSRLADRVTSWTDNVVVSMALPWGGEEGGDKMTTAVAKGEISSSLVGYSDDWRWRGLSRQQPGFEDEGVLRQYPSPFPDRSGDTGTTDPFGVVSFLDYLRRSEHRGVAFLYPRSPFPITQFAAAGALLDGSSLISVHHNGAVKATHSVPRKHRFPPTITLLEAKLSKDLAEHLGATVRE